MPKNYSKQLDEDFHKIVQELKLELSKEGLSILNEIDLKHLFEENVNLELDNYLIIGICHPLSSFKAYTLEPEVGMIIPSNIVVYTNHDGKTIISTINPIRYMAFIGNSELKEIARSLWLKLKKVIDSVYYNNKIFIKNE